MNCKECQKYMIETNDGFCSDECNLKYFKNCKPQIEAKEEVVYGNEIGFGQVRGGKVIHMIENEKTCCEQKLCEVDSSFNVSMVTCKKCKRLVLYDKLIDEGSIAVFSKPLERIEPTKVELPKISIEEKMTMKEIDQEEIKLEKQKKKIVRKRKKKIDRMSLALKRKKQKKLDKALKFLKRKQLKRDNRVKEIIQKKNDLIQMKKERQAAFRIYIDKEKDETYGEVLHIGVTTNGYQRHSLPELSFQESILLAADILCQIQDFIEKEL